MPLFYLHLCDGEGYHKDVEGVERASVEAARAAAIEGLRDTLAGDIKRGQLDIGSFIDIETRTGRRVDTVHFADAVKIANKACRVPTGE
jgi:hypothetical protein